VGATAFLCWTESWVACWLWSKPQPEDFQAVWLCCFATFRPSPTKRRLFNILLNWLPANSTYPLQDSTTLQNAPNAPTRRQHRPLYRFCNDLLFASKYDGEKRTQETALQGSRCVSRETAASFHQATIHTPNFATAPISNPTTEKTKHKKHNENPQKLNRIPYPAAV
jgi:hypothetical protein